MTILSIKYVHAAKIDKIIRKKYNLSNKDMIKITIDNKGNCTYKTISKVSDDIKVIFKGSDLLKLQAKLKE